MSSLFSLASLVPLVFLLSFSWSVCRQLTTLLLTLLLFHRYANGDYYNGEWDRGVIHGSGYFKYARGQGEYSGEFNYGKKHGVGQRKFSDGREYSGDWVEDWIHGSGVMDFPNNDRYSLPSSTVCPQLLFALNCLPQLFACLN